MRLNEILEENTVKGISQKTKISEDNLENLLAANFDTLKKIKTLGFISIIEREYQADLNALREEALAYYRQHNDEGNGFSVGGPVEEEKKGRSRLFLFVILALLGYASWYFFTQFDKKHLSQLIPFMDEQMIENVVTEGEEKKEDAVAELRIENVVVTDTQTNLVEEIVEEVVLQESTQSSEDMVKEVNVSLNPVSKF